MTPLPPLISRPEIPLGMCQCGCGQPTKPAPNNDKRRGWVRGVPLKYVLGHHTSYSLNKNPNWSGGRTQHRNGYVSLLRRDHPKASCRGYVLEHVLVAEAALGRPLPKGAEVHHVNGDKSDNRPENLVICPDLAYHQLLHQRMRALEACGNPSWVLCCYCKQHDDPERLVPYSYKGRVIRYYHGRGTCPTNSTERAA